MATKEQRPLTAKQRKFVEAYVGECNYSATQAYLAAYNAAPDTAKTEGPKLLKDKRVQDYMHELQREGLKAAGINAERVLQKLSEIAFSDKKDKDYTPGLQLKALDLISKNMGLQKTVVESDNITISVGITQDEDQPTTE